jgi:hypothetical protein
MDEWCWRSVVRSYHLLKEPATYRELGTDYFDRYSTERLKRRSLAQFQRPAIGSLCPSPHRCLAIIFQDADNSIDDCWRNPDSRENGGDPVRLKDLAAKVHRARVSDRPSGHGPLSPC